MWADNPMFGAALKGVGGAVAASGQANALNNQAAIDDENARRSILAGEQEVSQVNRNSRMAMGDQIASMAGSGFVPGAGGAADLITASAMNAARDVAAIRTKAQYGAANYEQDAAAKRASASAAVVNGIFGNVADALVAGNKMKQDRLLQSSLNEYRSTKLGLATPVSMTMPSWLTTPIAP